MTAMSPSTPVSMYNPTTDETSFMSPDSKETSRSSKDLLNDFLASRDISPIRNSLKTPWNDCSSRTQRYYTRKSRQVVEACLKEIAPNDVQMVLMTLSRESNAVNANCDSTLMAALVECYANATHWSSRRQILSIMADKVTFKELQRWIPYITRWRFDVARQHRLLHGRGAVVPVNKKTRMYIAHDKLDHFVSFITSPYVVQDVPFGEKKLKLSTNEEIRVPNVIRSLIPEQIVQQYEGYCKESGFQPMSRSSLRRVLDCCSASTRTSLQGLDYVTADGAKTFEELEDVVNQLGDDLSIGMTWAKDTTDKLKSSKRYMKSDYKARQ